MKRFFLIIRPSDIVTSFYFIFISILTLFFYDRIKDSRNIILTDISISFLIIIVAISIFRLKDEYSYLIRILGTTFLILFSFDQLSKIIHFVNPNDREKNLLSIDLWLFGLNPIEWLEKITTPLLTEFLQIVYLIYFFIPLFLAIILYLKKMFLPLQRVILAVVLGFYLNYISYILVPAKSPSYIVEHEKNQNMFNFKKPLEGVFFTKKIRDTLNSVEKNKRDCFPSGHTTIPLIIIFYAFIFHKKSFYILFPVSTFLIFSTVYLRYHYVIDVISGFALALITILISEKISGKWEIIYNNFNKLKMEI